MKIGLEAQHQKMHLELAREFADNHEEFDDVFIESLERSMESRGYLTDKQYQALKNVIEKWDMEDWQER